ncbi:Gfo/Idh/MocA family oxidoreductase [Actinoplanes sp. LDG1-06]|uniref:Gfo/Idh/MocA family oxidoreductase n=1 Tax=Paractinoplanes ovalisporus TaxID=2810368 RepID=A0ABS2A4B0_9ACTN|nr:Gfo/Idh/MocA family oxidoreductase [Actinoplanes ovalisporus]MBM2614540.1 Gfo/Idh/MocA family oxidoreductase [Actinoplanes ovalisporus]
MVGVALIGSGRMGSFHGETLARRLPGVRLVAVADPAPGAAEALIRAVGGVAAAYPGGVQAGADPHVDRAAAYEDVELVWADPRVDAVVVAAPARFHADLAVAAARAGKHVFCEKPMALTLEDADRVIDAARAAGVLLRVGFNRRFAPDWAAARRLIDDGQVGTPRLLRSLTRDPGGFDPARIPAGTIFNETLIHDFDTLRFLNPGAEAVEVHAVADALVEPEWRDRGLLDTAVVTVRFSNGAIGTAEACFEASYGYDVRGEVLGDGGMATMGDGRRTSLTFSGANGRLVETARGDQELFADAYIAELASFTTAVATRTAEARTGADGEDGHDAGREERRAADREDGHGAGREERRAADREDGHGAGREERHPAGREERRAAGGGVGNAGFAAVGEDARAALAVALAAAASVRTGKAVEVAK